MTQIITNSNGGGGSSSSGDMKKSVYDPQNIESDAFDYENFTNTPDLSVYQTTANLVTDLTNADDTHYPSAKAVSDAISGAGAGDMLKSVYDPNNIGKDAFDYDNFINTPTIPTDTSELTNGAGYITGIDSSDVTTALGYTPYNATNPNGYVTSSIINDTAYGSGWDGDTTHAPTKNAVYDKIDSIDELIPSAATSSNKLTDKNYVDDSINSVTAYYITKNAQGDQFATKAELTAATTFYSGGVVRVPTRNDYTIVLDDETHNDEVTRYIYNNGWEYQYTINESPLTQAQLDALNSGITSGKVSSYDSVVSTIAGYGNIVTHNTSEFATSTQGAKADSAVQPGDDVSDLVNDAGYLTSSTGVTSVNGNHGDVTAVGSSNNTYKDIIHLSQADYNNLGTYDPDTLYSTPDGEAGTFVDNTAYGNSWDGVTDKAPSQNAVYDKIESINEVPSGGTEGQVLTKGSSGYAWANASGGGVTSFTDYVEWCKTQGTAGYYSSSNDVGNQTYTTPGDGYLYAIDYAGTGSGGMYSIQLNGQPIFSSGVKSNVIGMSITVKKGDVFTYTNDTSCHGQLKFRLWVP